MACLVNLTKSSERVGALTGSTAESNPSQEACFKPLTVPDSQLSTGLAQVTAVEAIIHHGVVVCRADRALDHPRLLTTLPTGIWEDVACGGEDYSLRSNG